MVRTAGRYLRQTHVRLMHSTSGVCVCCLASDGTNLYGMMMYGGNEATQTHCYNPVVPAYPVWVYYVHGQQRRCQEDPVSLPSGRPEKTTRSYPHHVAQHRPTGSETTPPYDPRSSRFGSELPSVEDDVDVWRYAILELHARNDDDDIQAIGAGRAECSLTRYVSNTSEWSQVLRHGIVKNFVAQ